MRHVLNKSANRLFRRFGLYPDSMSSIDMLSYESSWLQIYAIIELRKLSNEVNELSDRVNDFGDRVSSFRRDVKNVSQSSKDKLEFAKYIINKNKGDQHGEDLR